MTSPGRSGGSRAGGGQARTEGARAPEPRQQPGRDAWALLTSGALNGLSIGYRARRTRLDAARRLRLLELVDLVEISLVTLPMHADARVIALG
ncbi:HK97 family phage prohead protease [Hankyongella ginsenosidimutans]|uniref:HK97 family phage prohead protease n=1 Tax=Hankyongella ginsenosidimutans TaxID=1763828 RepID=UPI00319E4780